MEPEQEPGGILQQLQDLYREREFLDQELGVSDAESIIGLVRSMEAQLCDLYATLAEADTENQEDAHG